jgi:hypothetical protein
VQEVVERKVADGQAETEHQAGGEHAPRKARAPCPGGRGCLTQRRAIVQLSLNLQDVPVPEARVWETLDDDQRALVIEILARLFAKAAAPPVAEEALRDE